MADMARHQKALRDAVMLVCPQHAPQVVEAYIRNMEHESGIPFEARVTFEVQYSFDIATTDYAVAEVVGGHILDQIDDDFMAHIWWRDGGQPEAASLRSVNINSSITLH